MPGANPAHTVAKIDPVCSTRTLHRPMMDGEDHGIAFCQTDDAAIALATSFLEAPSASKDLTSKSIDTEGSPASIFVNS
jgi:hypothetical protein